LTKLVLRMSNQPGGLDTVSCNMCSADIMLTIVSVIRYGKWEQSPSPIDSDSLQRMNLCLRVLSKPTAFVQKVFLEQCHDSFSQLLAEKAAEQPDEEKNRGPTSQADELIHFRHLRPRARPEELEDEGAADLEKAMGKKDDDDFSSRLNRVIQLTGLSDACYAEAYVTVHQYDILLDMLIVNRTQETLQNVCLELSCMGDLKLCERPQPHTMTPGQTVVVKANIKVSSTETGVIFGNIVYESTGGTADKANCVILNDIHIDIMDYIAPATCNDIQFRSMWAEFEWENKVAVNTSITDLQQFLEHVVKSTNMKCLTAKSSLTGDANYLAANLYAKSVFGEDALMNLCVEKGTDGKIGGYIRIRSKTQGIALSLGDKITLKQKGG